MSQNLKIALYAGSFDPLTNGHIWMIEQGSIFFDKLIVAVGINANKKSLLSIEDRISCIKKSIGDFKNVEVLSFQDQYQADLAVSLGAQFTLRGVRSAFDLQYEQTMQHFNSSLVPDLKTIVLLPPKNLEIVSSSFVKSLVGPQGWQKAVREYVPLASLELLEKSL